MLVKNPLPVHGLGKVLFTSRVAPNTSPTTQKAIDALRKAGILREITGRRRDRVYAYQAYLDVLAEDTEPIGRPG
jgi:hypothetical protein